MSVICEEEHIGQFCKPFFTRYHLGIGGPCEIFSPPAGYWCYPPANPGYEVQGGMSGPFTVPSGMTVNKTVLPHAPYANATGAVVHAWMSTGHWASWFFEVGERHNDTAFWWRKGGFQSARGSQNGGEFSISNVLEELDWPTEFFFDPVHRKA